MGIAMSERIEPVIGIIGGSGLYDIDGLEDKVWRPVPTPWGLPSDELLFGRLSGVRCVFLPRHGRGHPKSPTHLNYRANIDALKRSGVTDILSLSAVGSLRERDGVRGFDGRNDRTRHRHHRRLRPV
jgi:5'-methylthioadenosine phosphorylase